MEENETPLTPEEIEEQRELVMKIQANSRELLVAYLKVHEEERKKSFKESKQKILGLISEKSFLREKQREKDKERITIHPDIEKFADAISKSIGEKAFIFQQQKEKDILISELKPDFKEAYLGLAISYQFIGNFERAISNYKEYLELNKEEEVYLNIADLYIIENKLEKAKMILEEGLKHFPKSNKLKNMMVEVFKKLGS